MCLIKIHRFPKISSKPITVYKVLIPLNRIFITPCQSCKVYIGDTIKARKAWWKGVFKEGIEGEGVHAYVSIDNAKENIYGNDVIAEVEIPPYTPYWIGKAGDMAASKMKIIKLL